MRIINIAYENREEYGFEMLQCQFLNILFQVMIWYCSSQLQLCIKSVRQMLMYNVTLHHLALPFISPIVSGKFSPSVSLSNKVSRPAVKVNTPNTISGRYG